ncbi:MAG: hypothetical protein FJ271_16950 [Planctomycetes bacterium]|nr:hypothetical protein [Planctomycetota bacterium]
MIRTKTAWLLGSLLFGLLYWWFADWWAYVEFRDGAMPKFVMPWWWQLVESSFVGFIASALLLVGCHVVRWASLQCSFVRREQL